jgi:NH3-dependent NAD+ synthetase
MLRDIGHPFSRGEAVYDITFENVQAGERSSHLFRLANLHGGLVLGTGDLSELALGWSDFNLYYVTRYGFRPSKVAFLAHHAWGNSALGEWPPGFPTQARRSYDLPTIKRWLRVFLYRFFQTSQFKRSAIPNAPKVGSGGSLSPRSDWRAPSDSEATIWLQELEHNVAG